MSKPRVLILSDWFVPGYKAGGPIQSIKNLCQLIGEDVSIDVVCGDRDLGEEQPYDGIATGKWVSWNQCRVMYLGPGEDHVLKSTLSEDYDTVYLNSFFSWRFTIKPLLRLKSLKKLDAVILAPRGMLGGGALKLKSFKKKSFIKAFKALGFHKTIAFHTTDVSETKDVKQILGPRVKLYEVSNIPVTASHAPKTSHHSPRRLVFASRISPKKNLHFLLDVLSDLGADQRFILDIFGQPDDAAYFEHCKKRWTTLSSATYHGAVANEQLMEALRRADYFVLPTLNENFGHVIVEALASGTPAIISDQCPWTDLEKRGGGWVLSLENGAEWKTALEAALELEQEAYGRMSSAAIQYVEEKLDISALQTHYLKMFDAD